MIKSNIVTIGKGFWVDTQKIMRIYEKKTGVKVEGSFKRLSVEIMNDISLDKNDKEELHIYYKQFESSILKDENLNIFCFLNKEDFEKFDIDGLLKDRAIIIDKIEEKDHPMDVKELWTCIDKSYKHCHEGSHKVVLVDTASSKEYLIGVYEPRRTFIKETDTTVEFGIYPVKTKVVKEVEKVNISKFIQSKLDEINKNPYWLACEMGVATSSIYGKFERDSFSAYDLIKVANILNISLEELIDTVEIS